MALKRFSLDLASLSAARIVQTLAGFASLPIIARLLGPHEFGLVAVAMGFVVATIFMADAGMGQSLVRTPSSDTTTWSSAFWAITSFGVGLSLLLVVVAFAAPIVFGEPRLFGLILGLAVIPFLVASLAAPTAEMQQRQKFRELAGIEGVSALTALGVAIATAFHGAGAWALVLQQIAFWLTKGLLVIWRTRFRPRLVFSRHNLSDHLRFARDNTGTTILYFFARQIDPLVIGRVLGTAPTGLYAFATRIMNLPQQLVASPVQNALYVRMVELRDDKEALRDLLLIMTTCIGLLVFPGVAILAAASSAYFSVLLSHDWSEAGPVFTLLAPVAAMQTILVPANALVLATGNTAIRLRQTFELAILWVVLLPVTAQFGLPVIAAAFSLANVLYMPRALQMTLPVIDLRIRAFLIAILPATMAGIALYAGHSLIRTYVPMSELQEIALSLTELALAYAALLYTSRIALQAQIKTLRGLMLRSAPRAEQA
jgi:O-antigen/teichoic acid export membrane protein